MQQYIKRHKETFIVLIIGLVVFAALNIMMMFYHYDAWTNPRVGFWTAFWNRFEVSGFDPYTYIVVSDWRPLYVISRHPLLSVMMWPLSELNSLLDDITGVNCAIHIIAVVWTLLSTGSWLLMFRILRKLMQLTFSCSLLLTVFFFSFSHVLMITFVEDHMALTLFMLLLTIYLAGKSMKEGKTMPLWQSLPLLFVSTGITTTNCVKVGLADLCTRWGKDTLSSFFKHFAYYLIPLLIVGGLYWWQMETTQVEEKENINNTVTQRARKDSTFAKFWTNNQKKLKKIKSNQLIHLSFVTNTDYKIDRLPSLIDNVFGEGLILHSRYCLRDANKEHRPVDVKYTHWWYYAIEAVIVAIFLAGVWCGRKERLLWMALSMFLFDMLLHVGLNFASADVYIMTAHWAFVIPIAVGYLLKHIQGNVRLANTIVLLVFFLALFMLTHNMQLIYNHIIG